MNIFAPPRPRSVLAITGEEATDFLQGLVTNDMARLATEDLLYAALLSPQGKILHAFFISNRDDGGYWLDVVADHASDLMRRLRMFRLRASVEIENASTAMMVACGTGNGDPRDARLGKRAIVPLADLPPAPPQYEQNRLAACVPDQSVDFGMEEIFASDANMDLQNGVAFKKGCYVGQEVVSRMKRRGTIRKRMALARFEGDAPDNGTAIMAGKARLGDVRSSLGNQAIALIRTDRLETALQQNIPVTANDIPLTLSLPEQTA
jgi:tRNA-modifying protein YgfZ